MKLVGGQRRDVQVRLRHWALILRAEGVWDLTGLWQSSVTSWMWVCFEAIKHLLMKGKDLKTGQCRE